MMRQISFSLFLIGCAAVVGQVVFMRELMVVFYGNELSTAVILGSWLLWTSIGSAILGRRADAVKGKRKAFALVQLSLSMVMPASLIGVRSSKLLWEVPVGEVPGVAKMVGVCFTVLAPFCLLSGLLFALGCALYGDIRGARERSAGTVYMIEAMGSAFGGVVVAILLMHGVNHLECCLVTSAFLIISCASLFLQSIRKREGTPLLVGLCPLAATILTPLALDLQRWEDETRGWQWKGHRMIASEETAYGVLTAVSADGLTSFYQNGLWMFAYPDPRAAEESVHLALLQHPKPESVLLIGGALSGSLTEALKHPSLRKVECIELDPEAIQFGRRVLGRKATSALEDPKVRLIHEDGRRYIRKTKSRYDVVIVNLPDPMTAQLNRFYTVEFFQEVRQIMNPGGIFATSLSASEDIIGPTLAGLLRSLRDSMAQVFPEVLVFPGATARYLGRREAAVLLSDPVVLLERMKQRELRLAYVREYYLLFNLSQERLAYLASMLDRAYGARINRDLTPSCYFYDFIHWSAQHEPGLKGLLTLAEGRKFAALTVLAGLIGAICVLIAPKGERSYTLVRPRVLYSCVVAGCSQMILTVVTLVSFQILYGYVYSMIAVLIALYMAGLVVGSWHMTSRVERLESPSKALTWIQGGMAAYPIVLLGVVSLTHQRIYAFTGLGLTQWILPFLISIAGYLGGAHFPLANATYLARSEWVGRTASLIYGLDLVGSAGGALLAGVLLLPLAGIPDTLFVVAACNLVAFALLATCAFKKP